MASAAARSAPSRTAPLRVTSPFFAVASTGDRYGAAQGERVVRHGGQSRVVAEIAWRQRDLQAVVHALDTGDATGHRGRLDILRVARHAPGQHHVTVPVLDGDA